MSARGPSNLRYWVGWGVKKAGKLGYRKKMAPKTVSGDTTANGHRKGVPNSRRGNSKAERTKTYADTGNKQFGVRRTQGKRWNVM